MARRRSGVLVGSLFLAVPAIGIAADGQQGISVQGISVQGISVQGISVQGISVQGISVQGISVQGISVQGTDVVGSEIKGVDMSSVELRGTTGTSDAVLPHVLTNIPTMSAGPGNYISVGGGSAVGHYAVAHMLDAHGAATDDLDLYIAAEQKDPVPNLFHRFEEQDNQDELYVVYFFHKWSGEWMSLCPYNPATGSASAMAIPEDPGDPNKFVFACTATGVASKCARNWGYRPWAQTTAYVYDATANGGLGAWAPKTFALRDYYNVCKSAAQASYCQDGRSYTKNGTQVDLFDTRQIIWPNSIENPWSAANGESLWMMAQEYFISRAPDPDFPSIKDSALQRTRYRELSPVGECGNMAFVDRLEHDNIEDGRWASPLTNVERIQVFSPTYCSHDEDHEGDQLPWDCSPCTTQVCKTMPGCCGAGATPGWTAACTTKAAAVCQTGGVRWPLGKVWPRDMPSDDQSAYPTFLVGPAGAVLRADGVSGSGSSATISGWACDPEWAGASVGLQIYGGAPREDGGTLLGEIRADQPLATPLAREVSAACDGPGRSYASHGFSFTLPTDQSGNVFVYAIDQSTVNGPAAPPTLLRNGIVHVPRCAHGEHVTGEALAADCSACAASVCGDEIHDSCCTTEWTDECAAAADACAPSDSSAPANSRSFAAVTTGWIEAKTSGLYTFEAAQVPSRLFINGTKVLDWFETSPGTTSGTITLSAGQKYAFRWDRFQAEPPSGTPVQGVQWRLPSTSPLKDIPSENLYAITSGSGTGLTARYFDSPGFAGASTTRLDATVDINNDIAPPGPPALDVPAGYGPSYSAVWEGEIVPSFTEDYSFYVVGAGTPTLYIDGAAVSFPPSPLSSAPGGCAHDLCVPGDKLDASCNSCVHDICQKDHHCCDGGYLSYYSTEPEWDAKCIAEVEKYCAPSKCTTPLPLPPSVSPQAKSAAKALQAGVHYSIRFEYDNPTGDKTIRLLWASASQAKQAIPQFALFPKDAIESKVGAGLNVLYFAAKSQNGVIKPDLSAAVAGGMVADLSLTPPVGQLGMPQVNVLATPVDAASGKPSPPTIVRPRFQEEVFVGGAMTVHVTGIGGITGGFVHITVEGGSGDVLVPVGPGGEFAADVPVALGLQKLKIVQQTFSAAPCVAPALCAVSQDVIWPITVTLETASPKAPVILSPTDPTHSGVAAPLVVNVVGHGTTGPLHVVDQGTGAAAQPDILPDANGKFSAPITLASGTPADPNKGWHKLVFDQGGAASHPVFVSVGIDPPTVEFPRTGAQIDCDEPDPLQPIKATGTIPYPEDVFGRLRVFEETGRQQLGQVGEKTRILTQQPQPGVPVRFETIISAGSGRHVLYFFQAPDPPAQATQEEIDAHFRAYARLADTPTSRIVIERKPLRFPIPAGTAGIFGGRTRFDTIANIPQTGQGALPIIVTDCGPNANPRSAFCAEANADVNVRLSGRLFTTRADGDGAWSLSVPLPLGWNQLTFAQVSDSLVGGAWSESCESNAIGVGVRSPNGPVIPALDDISVVATSPQGATVVYPPVFGYVATTGEAIAADCVPASGSVFRLGQTAVLCSATDSTGAVGLGDFTVTVEDGPPRIKVPKIITAEATSALGAMVSYEVTASDAVDGPVAVECAPSSPAQFPLDGQTPVRCEATDHLNHTTEAIFLVRVVDTTPPDLCFLPDIKVGSGASGGAFVDFNPCAKDVVDGPLTASCDHARGSFFPVGKTVVTCSAVDGHQNQSAPSSFTVEVGDSTPPVLKLPTVVSAIATSRSGARVSYTVTATDNVDPNPKVKCDPPSGALFPLGKTPVNCTATDAAGNLSTGSFIVKVTVGWTGFLAPVNQNGSSRFLLGLPIALRFALSGASANVYDLNPKLFVAPLNAAGTPGAERSATGLPPGAGNLFYFIPIINQYAMLLDTRPLGVGPWQLRVDLGDGEVHTQRITFFRL